MKVKASYHQERLWFIDNFERDTLYEKGTVYHNIPLILKCCFELDYQIVERAVQHLIEENEILHTDIINEDGLLYQHIGEAKDYLCIEYLEQGNEDDKEPVAKLLELNENAFADGLHFPYMKVYCLKVTSDLHYILFTMHHFVCDSYSKELVKQSFIQKYVQLEQNQECTDGKELQYADFSEWQREMPDEMIEDQMLYWKKKASGRQLQALELPIDCVRKLIHIYDASTYLEQIDGKLMEQIEATANRMQCSNEVFFLSVFKLLMYKMSGLKEINIGTSILNRKDSGLKNTIGPIANLVLLSDDYEEACDFQGFLNKTKSTLEQADKNSDIPFDKLVTELKPVKDMSRTALFDILFQYEEESEKQDERFEEIENNLGWGKYDYNLLIKKKKDGVQLYLTYNGLYYNQNTAQRLIKTFLKLLSEVIKDSSKMVQEYECIIDEEKELLVNNYYSIGPKEYSKLTIPEAIRLQAARVPDKIAVTDGVKSYSYQELESYSNQLAGYLMEKGIKQKEIVAVILDKSSDFIVTVLGILKTGCTYLPIDPMLPEDRMDYMLEDSYSSWIICRKQDEVKYSDKAHVFSAEKVFSEMSVLPEMLEYSIENDYAAYIIYTSGTTGKPKGMMIEHRNVTSLIYNNLPLFDFTDDDVWSCSHNCNFDFSIWEIYGPLFTGGKLVIFTKEECKEIETMRKKLVENKVTILSQTPLAFYALSEFEKEQKKYDLSIRNVIFGGEALEVAKLKTWRMLYKQTEFINMYGITETTVHVTFKKVTDYEIDNNINSIGRPLIGYEVYVLDEGNCLCPIGVKGEMFVGGTGVGRGYLNREELTSSKFIKNTFRDGRVYRSGDYACWDEEGNLHYMGRMDEQIKIRGFRIELGEIETHLRKIDGVEDAVTVARNDLSGTKCINAYIVSKQQLSFHEIKKELAKNLPDYMIPAHFAIINQLPVTENGKLNKKMLPDIQNDRTVEFVTARDKKESILVQLFRDILGVKKVSIYDNFFDLGGDSIKAMRFVAQLKKYGYELLIKDLMQANTLEEIGERLTLCEDILKYEQGEVNGEYAKAPIQQEFFKVPYEQSQYYYQSILLKSSERIDVEILEYTLAKLLEHHDMLRVVFREGKQIVLSTKECKLVNCEQLQIQDENESVAQQKIKSYCENLMQDTDLEHGPLMKCCLIHKGEADLLFLAIHHLAVDGVSWNILSEDMDSIYNQVKNQSEIIVQPKTASYKEWVNAMDKAYDAGYFDSDTAYWEKVNHEIEEIDLEKKTDVPVKRIVRKLVWGKKDTEIIRYVLADALHAKVQDILLAAIVKTANSLLQGDSISVDMESQGRNDMLEHISIDRTLGWFTAIYPICIRYADSMKELLKQIEKTLNEVPHYGIGYHVLKKYEKIQRRRDSLLCFNFMGDYEEYFENQQLWSIITECNIREISEANIMTNYIIVDIYFNKEELNMELTFNAEYLDMEFCEEFEEKLSLVLADMMNEGENYEEAESEEDNRIEDISDETFDEIMNLLD